MTRAKKKKKSNLAAFASGGTIATNRRARYEYHILDEFEAGIMLKGSEIKSIRSGRVDISAGYAQIRDREAWLINVHIAPYEYAGMYGQHDPLRDRKLLLNRREIDLLQRKSEQERLTIVVLRIYIVGGIAKAAIALARGKRLSDRRETIRQRDADRDIARAMRAR